MPRIHANHVFSGLRARAKLAPVLLQRWLLTAVRGGSPTQRRAAVSSPDSAQPCEKPLTKAKNPPHGKRRGFFQRSISRPPHSTALPPLHDLIGRTGDLSGVARSSRKGAQLRRDAKNERSSSPHSSRSGPASTSGRWLRRSSASTSSTLPQAPAFGSSAPKTTRPIHGGQ